MLTLKIGRNKYDITENDKFLDNGACIQLLTQNKNKPGAWGRRPVPVLSKMAEKELKAFLRIQRKHNYGASVEVFSISTV